MAEFKKTVGEKPKRLRTVIVPEALQFLFDKAEANVGKYHKSLELNPENGTIEISGQRYLLLRASALSIEFLEGIMKYYRDRGEKEAMAIGKNILFDLAHLIGVEDAANFKRLMSLKNPMDLLSAGPIHFAYTGWAQVQIHQDSNPMPNKNFILRYSHPYSFEADSWIKAGKKSEQPVCVMNSGYSSGWCEHSFGIKLTAVEITCKARGDAECSFIMAPPDRIHQYLQEYPDIRKDELEIPTFLQRKIMEEKLASSLTEKELLLKEIHHRVKNNMQIISSLLNLQLDTISDPTIHYKFKESIDRIRSMASVHDLLYRSNDFSHIPVSKYFNSLINSLKYSYNMKKNIKVEVKLNLKKDVLDINNAIPCGLILNEILSNAFKYAFEGKRNGNIQITFTDNIKSKNRKYRLTVTDDGIGFIQEPDLVHAKTLGMQLIHSLVEQLEGVIHIKSDKGTLIQIDF